MSFEDFYEEYLLTDPVEYDPELSLIMNHENSREEININELEFSEDHKDDYSS